MYILKQPLWTTDYPRSNHQGTVLGNFEDWPVSYQEVEQAFGCPLKDQPRWMQKHPIERRNHGGMVNYQPEVLMLMCEFLRLREATEKSGTRTAYFLRTSMPMGDDRIQAFMEIEPKPASLFRKVTESLKVESLRASASKPLHREHKLAFGEQWLDDGLYRLDFEMGRKPEKRIRIDLNQDWDTQMGKQFGPAYQARIRATQLDTYIPDPTCPRGRKHRL